MSINIRQKRFAAAVNQILQEELQRGNLPTSLEFSSRLRAFLASQDLGEPEYSFSRVRNGEVAKSAFYNQAVETIQKDLMILYENAIATHNDLQGKFSWFEVEKNRLENEVSSLRNTLEEKILLYGKTGYLASVFDVFDDLSKIESEENLAIDVLNNQVALRQQQNTSFLITPEASASFVMPQHVTSTFRRLPISGKIQNIFEEGENETFQELWLANSEGPAEAYVDVLFKERQVLNRIDLGIHTIGESNIFPTFTLDGSQYFHLPFYSEGKNTEDSVSFNFPMTEMTGLRIWIRKASSDKTIVHPDNYQYQYLFGVKHIHFFQLSFPAEGHFITKKLSPDTNENFAIGKVSLVTEEELPDGTNIEYFVSVGDETVWRPITPVNRDVAVNPQVVDFKNITSTTPIELGIKEGASAQEAEVVELQANGISFYSLGGIENQMIIPRTERLYIGKNAWFVNSTVNDLGSIHLPSLSDWDRPPNRLSREIKNIEDGNRGLILNSEIFTQHTQLHFGLGIYSEDSEQVLSTIPSSTEPIVICLNGEKLFEGIPSAHIRVNYRFRKGWNDIVVLAYIQNLNQVTTIDLGFDPTAVSTHCYASSTPLEKVSVFDLRFNTRNDDWGKYALYEKDNIVYVVVNHSLPGTVYEFFYDYTNMNAHREIKMKAVFRQNSVGRFTTPVLNRYTLQFS